MRPLRNILITTSVALCALGGASQAMAKPAAPHIAGKVKAGATVSLASHWKPATPKRAKRIRVRYQWEYQASGKWKTAPGAKNTRKLKITRKDAKSKIRLRIMVTYRLGSSHKTRTLKPAFTNTLSAASGNAKGTGTGSTGTGTGSTGTTGTSSGSGSGSSSGSGSQKVPDPTIVVVAQDAADMSAMNADVTANASSLTSATATVTLTGQGAGAPTYTFPAAYNKATHFFTAHDPENGTIALGIYNMSITVQTANGAETFSTFQDGSAATWAEKGNGGYLTVTVTQGQAFARIAQSTTNPDQPAAETSCAGAGQPWQSATLPSSNPVASVSLPAGQETISGTVTDGNGRPLPGAAVVMTDGSGSQTTLTTDSTGAFSTTITGTTQNLSFSFNQNNGFYQAALGFNVTTS